MAELKCKDGTIIEISDETEAELRKASSKPEWKFGDVAAYRSKFNGITDIQCYLYDKNGKLAWFYLNKGSHSNPYGLKVGGPEVEEYIEIGNIFEDKKY